VKFTVDGTAYEVDLDRMTYDEAEFVYDNTGFGMWEFGHALQRAVPKAIKALIILGKRGAGEALRWQDIPGSIDITAPSLSVLEGLFRPLQDAADEQAAGAKAKADPTERGETPGSEPGTDPGSGSAATSSG
jgi:hypothetical protein